MAIEQQNNDYDLAAGADVYTKTAAAAGEYKFRLRIGDGTLDLHTDAASLGVRVTVGGQTVGGGLQYFAKDAAISRAQISVGPYVVANGETVNIYLLSNNANDESVDVTVDPERMADVDADGCIAADAVKMAGESAAALDPDKLAALAADWAAEGTLNEMLDDLHAAAGTLEEEEREAVAAALLDQAGAIDGLTPREALQVLGAVFGVSDGAGSGEENFTGFDGETPRVTVNTDEDGNRTGVTFHLD